MRSRNDVDEFESHKQKRSLPPRHETPLRKGRITNASLAALHSRKAGLSLTPVSLLSDSPRNDVIPLTERSSDTADVSLTGRLSHATAKSTEEHAAATPRPPKASSDIKRMIVDDSHRQYEYLQSLHLQQLALHDGVFDQQGVLMPNNGCEQVLKPKPHLSYRQSRPRFRSPGKLTRCLDPDKDEVISEEARSTAKKNRQNMFFECNRRPPGPCHATAITDQPRSRFRGTAGTASMSSWPSRMTTRTHCLWSQKEYQSAELPPKQLTWEERR